MNTHIKNGIGQQSRLFPHMSCPSCVDERMYLHIKKHSSKTKKSLFARMKSISYTTMFSSMVVVVTSIFLGISQMPSSTDNLAISTHGDNIELTLQDIDTALSFIEDDTQREFDTL